MLNAISSATYPTEQIGMTLFICLIYCDQVFLILGSCHQNNLSIRFLILVLFYLCGTIVYQFLPFLHTILDVSIVEGKITFVIFLRKPWPDKILKDYTNMTINRELIVCTLCNI